jgi:hypothetical protein
MRKKTAPATQKHGQTSHLEEKGLIAKGNKARHSAVEAGALDDLSHRTEEVIRIPGEPLLFPRVRDGDLRDLRFRNWITAQSTGGHAAA